MTKLVWKYGWSPVRTRQLIKQYMREFYRMFTFDDQLYPNPMLPPEDDRDHTILDDALEESGTEFLQKRGVSPKFLEDILEPRARMARAQDLHIMHGFAAIQSVSDAGQGGEEVFIENGNWQMFYGMLHDSGANIELNTKVLNISNKRDGTGFKVTTAMTGLSQSENDGEPPRINSDYYDAVIIAAPFTPANITFDFSLPTGAPDKNASYVPLHVTLFTSPFPHLSPLAFNLSSRSMIASNILTTKGKTFENDSAADHPYFYSARIIRSATTWLSTSSASNGGPRVPLTEYVIRIDSPKALSDDQIIELSGLPPRSDGTPGVTWLRRHVWENAFVLQEPRGWFEDVKLADGLYYVGGMGRVWDGMEAMALMGKVIGREIAKILEPLANVRGS